MQWVSMHVRVFLCTLGNFRRDYEALDRISEVIFVVTLYTYINLPQVILKCLFLFFENT